MPHQCEKLDHFEVCVRCKTKGRKGHKVGQEVKVSR